MYVDYIIDIFLTRTHPASKSHRHSDFTPFFVPTETTFAASLVVFAPTVVVVVVVVH